MRLRSLALPVAFFGALYGVACSTQTIIVKHSATADAGDGADADVTEGDDTAPTEGDDASTIANDGGRTPPDAAIDAGPFVMASHRAFPQVPGNSRQVLAPLKLVSIFTSTETFVSDLTDFGNALVASQWFQTTGHEYGLTTATHVAIHASTTLAGTVTEQQMDSFIATAIQSHPEAANDGNTMYLLYLPPGVGDQGNANCVQHGGYHTSDQSGRAWGMVERCPTTGTGFSELEQLTVFASHEVIEAATDPVTGGLSWTLGQLESPASSTWTSAGGEVGDLCVGTQIREGSYTYQRVYSNVAAAAGLDPCIPAQPAAPYYNVTTPKDWYPVAAGASVDIPISAWSTVRMKDWYFEANPSPLGGSGTFNVTYTSPTGVTVGSTFYPTLNNGVTGTVTVTAPAQHGSFVVIWVTSAEASPKLSSDSYHFWPVGVYVP